MDSSADDAPSTIPGELEELALCEELLCTLVLDSILVSAHIIVHNFFSDCNNSFFPSGKKRCTEIQVK